MVTKIIFSKKCLEYGVPEYPENSIRVEKAYDFLMSHGYEFTEPKPADENDLARVHSEEYLEELREGTIEDSHTRIRGNL